MAVTDLDKCREAVELYVAQDNDVYRQYMAEITFNAVTQLASDEPVRIGGAA